MIAPAGMSALGVKADVAGLGYGPAANDPKRTFAECRSSLHLLTLTILVKFTSTWYRVLLVD